MALALSSVACGPPSAEAPTLPLPTPRPAVPLTTRFDCAGDIVTATFHHNRVVLDVAALTLTLPLMPHARAASGARYTDGTSSFVNGSGSSARAATLETGGRTVPCAPVSDPWQQAMERGVELRAVGQEPGWLLEIDDGAQMHLVYDYGEHEVTMAAPAPVRTELTTTYQAATPMHRLRVVVEARPCADAMSGDASPTAVAVVIDGRTLEGCGRFLNEWPDAPAR
jgi:uncharacterized membrane protein